MANSDAGGARRVRCPRCHSVLEEPSAPVYQCGGCGASLRAKNRAGDTQGVASASSSRTGLPPQSRHSGSTDVASTSASTPDATSSRRQGTDTASRHTTGDLVSARDVASTSSTPEASSSRREGAGMPSRRATGDLVSVRNHGSGDAASTSSAHDATGSRRQVPDMTSLRETGDRVPARIHVSEQVQLIQKRLHDQSTDREVPGNSEARRRTDAGVAECSAGSPGVSVHFPRAGKTTTSEFQDDAEKRRQGGQAEAELPDASRTKDSGEAAAAQSWPRDRAEIAPASPQAADSQSARDVLRRKDEAAAAAAGAKARSPPRHELQSENLAPLRKKILKTVDELKDDLSELFSKSPELNPTTRHPPPRRPKQEGHASRAAMASDLRARGRRATAAAVDHRGSAARAVKPGQVATVAAPPRGLPSRRYRRCRADPCCDSLQPRSCHHGCCDCGHRHGRPAECSSCRGHCGKPRAPEPSAPRRPPAANEAVRRRPAPRHHCRPVLKGAPFIICSSCFELVQVPADFAVSTKAVRKLRCGSCSAVLSYSYRDPARKNAQEDSMDERFSTDGSEAHAGGRGHALPRDPFAFLDDFGHGVSYSTEDEQPLHVSRNTSFGTVDGANAVGRLHRLMGYGSASELLRCSPDLYESFDERATPDAAGQYDRKGKGVCLDDDDDGAAADDSSDDEGSGALKRSAARGSGWPLSGMIGKGTPAPGAIRIKS